MRKLWRWKTNWWLPGVWGGGGEAQCDYQGVAFLCFVVLEQFCILIVMVISGIHTCDESDIEMVHNFFKNEGRVGPE